MCDVQSGKSSICKLLTREVAPTSGAVILDETDISCIANERLGILYLPGIPTYFENRSVLYNIAYPLKVRKISKQQRTERAAEIAGKLGIKDLKVKIRKLNLAERKRVALARGLTVERQVVLFDDFFDDCEDVDDVLDMFSAKIKVIFTSDTRLTRGHCVVLDGGYTEYVGDVDGACRRIAQLEWLYDKIQTDN